MVPSESHVLTVSRGFLVVQSHGRCWVQNAKLSVFATRPGIRSPLFNWIVVSSHPCRVLLVGLRDCSLYSKHDCLIIGCEVC